ncbi:MAG TPA: DUF2252 domain-containing protein [Solirubrobacteraceae bacterium]|jgi:uncharacterized protein (DUF2252 family)|nr:DUF2252 domain-containing protein [Solirubrobacteraceae bacterium]
MPAAPQIRAIAREAATPDDRAAVGKTLRKQAPRSSHGDWRPAIDRPDPVAVLVEQARGRVAELLPLRYGRMLVSPFSFYRGAAAIMAADLAATPTSGLRVQLCGDAHLSNFGTFSSPERELVFDISDFDETLPGPWEWDVKRLAASVCIAGRDRELSAKQVAHAVRQTAAAYREAMSTFAGQGNLEVWYAHLDVDAISRLFAEGVDVKRMKELERQLEKARLNTSVKALGKLTETRDGKVRFLHKPPLLVPADELLTDEDRVDAESNLRGMLGGYRASLTADRRTLLDGYAYASMARKVVGVGSVGMRVWVVLLYGRDGGDPLLLQAKEATSSVLERHLEPAAQVNRGERVVEGQKLMQAASDIFLGWSVAPGTDDTTRDYYVRQAADGKGAVDVSLLLPAGLAGYGRMCGWTLARAHARSGDRIAISGYLGRGEAFDRAIAEFAERYADQNAADFAALRAAVADGRVQAASEQTG